MTSLNGGPKTHPLKPKSFRVLVELLKGPKRCFRINPDTVDRLVRGGLARVSIIQNCTHLFITEAGKAYVRENTK